MFCYVENDAHFSNTLEESGEMKKWCKISEYSRVRKEKS